MRMPANPLRAPLFLPTLAGALLAVAACSSSSSGAGADSGSNYGDMPEGGGSGGGDGAASDAHGEGGPRYDCSNPTLPVDTFMTNMARDGKGGLFRFLLAQAMPAPPAAGAGAAGKNTWTVKVLDGAGQPVMNEKMSMPTNTQAWNYPFDPLMAEHGTGIAPTSIKDNGDGTSTIVMNLVNPGIWWFFFQATDGTTTDGASFSFCLP